MSDRAMKQVSRETGARFAGVLYVDSLTEPTGPAPTYAKLLEYKCQGHYRRLCRSTGQAALMQMGSDPATQGDGTADQLDLIVSGVTVAYPNGHVGLHDASMRLDGPTICGLLGVNGAGESTLFKAVMGLVTPASGTVRIGGRSVLQAQRSNWVAYVPQAEEVDWGFPVSVRDVVMMERYGDMGMLRIPRGPDRAAVAAALRRVGLEGFADRQIGQLSGGQKKRCSWRGPWRRTGG